VKSPAKIITLIASTVLITRLWELFYNGYEPIVIFWGKLGLDLTKKYDWFLFYDMEQYVHWYAQYTNYLLSIIILSYLVYILLRSSIIKALTIASKVLLFFSIFRLISYWLFRGNINFELICTAIAMFLLLIIPKCSRFWR
jgi:hypothetical protein